MDPILQRNIQELGGLRPSGKMVNKGSIELNNLWHLNVTHLLVLNYICQVWDHVNIKSRSG